MVSVTALQFALLPEVRISVTLPAVVSAVLGIYVAFKVLAFGVNVPLPLVLHVPEPVLDVPFKVTLGLVLQTFTFAPAFTFGAGVIVMITVSVTALHNPFPVVVRTSVTLCAVVSAALGI